ncbi:hypothetical protein WJX72_002359 [[Myrmecia] bisecta]|uniref:Uncharacterized protein n=1 Tax=[Myrmecia] bisecta TaxID=41462 RepID=A0AAW1Q9U8_9CHLO
MMTETPTHSGAEASTDAAQARMRKQFAELAQDFRFNLALLEERDVELERLGLQLDAALAANESVNTALHQAHARHDKEQQQLEAQHAQQAASLEARHAQHAAKLAAVERQLADAQALVRQLQERQQAAEAADAASRAQLGALRAHLRDTQADNSFLSGQLEACIAALKTQEATAAWQEGQIHELSATLGTTRDRVRLLERACEAEARLACQAGASRRR